MSSSSMWQTPPERNIEERLPVDGVKIALIEGKFRGIVATKAFKPGDVIIDEAPYAAVASLDELDSMCSRELRELPASDAGSRCAACRAVRCVPFRARQACCGIRCDSMTYVCIIQSFRSLFYALSLVLQVLQQGSTESGLGSWAQVRVQGATEDGRSHASHDDTPRCSRPVAVAERNERRRRAVLGFLRGNRVSRGPHWQWQRRGRRKADDGTRGNQPQYKVCLCQSCHALPV
jgi:hypothetical protein